MTMQDTGILSLDSGVEVTGVEVAGVEVSQSVDSIVVVLTPFDYNIDM